MKYNVHTRTITAWGVTNCVFSLHYPGHNVTFSMHPSSVTGTTAFGTTFLYGLYHQPEFDMFKQY